MPILTPLKHGEHVIGIRLHGQEFVADLDQLFVPRQYLHGFVLSEIPANLVLYPVLAVRGDIIEIDYDICVFGYSDGYASAGVNFEERRKLWDGEVGLAKFMAALHQAIVERQEAFADIEKTDYEDDGDYIWIGIEIRFGDIDIQDALSRVDSIVRDLEAVRDEILARRQDSLLDVLDRASLERDLARSYEQLRLGVDGVSLILADVDHFKKVNDTHGHLVGDVVLKGVAELLKRTIGSKGNAYRYGGEELVALLPGLTANEASVLAESFREQVEAATFDQERVRVTISSGVADSHTAKSPEELVRLADRALYQAKNAGRNRVQLHRA